MVGFPRTQHLERFSLHCFWDLIRLRKNTNDFMFFYDEGLPKIEILTLRANSWREIAEETYPSSFSREGCIFLNGILYWINHSSNNHVVYFDFREEKFGILSPPNNGNVMPVTLWEKLIRYWVSSHQNTLIAPSARMML